MVFISAFLGTVNVQGNPAASRPWHIINKEPGVEPEGEGPKDYEINSKS